MKHSARILISTLAALLLGGCAAQSPRAAAADPAAAVLLRPGDAISVRVHSTTSDIALLDSDAARVSDKLRRSFAQAKASGAPRSDGYQVDVAIVGYSQGHEYIRAMLPYDGHTRLDAVVTVTRVAGDPAVGSFMVSRTLDPAAVSSPGSRIGDIEDPLVQAVVEGLLGMPGGNVVAGVAMPAG